MDGEAGPLDEGAERCFALVQGLIALSELTRAIGLAAAPSSRSRSTSSKQGAGGFEDRGEPDCGRGLRRNTGAADAAGTDALTATRAWERRVGCAQGACHSRAGRAMAGGAHDHGCRAPE